ncbi:GntR family transcriptional regulator [Sagittula salina]|uniref:GntR family transcriptional regulator n=1 Tax=Sagittula salina TaxID=2820268 RepID=A0A940S3J4_9RHOB|nr:GntR family transcriptional regulator [Sagittula salina]MBP0485136.1 GntR family transcriptional regulator [Sagittula salina]
MSDTALASLSVAPQKSATDLVFDTLYQAVISLQLPPGTRVSEAEVAQQLNVSRQPVRDAFFRLSKLGFLLIRPQRATQITRISRKAVLDAAFIRTAIESECLREAVRRMTPEAATQLHESLAAQQEALTTDDPTRFHALDDGFHQTLARIAGHSHAWDLISEQKAHMDRVRYLTLSSARQLTVYQEHKRMVEALIAQDVVAAEAQLRAHLGDIANVLERVRAEHPDHFDDSARG